MKFSKLFVMLAAALMLLAFGSGAVLAAEGKVFQGTCVSYDAEKKVMVLKNDKNERDKNPVDKNLEEVTFDISQGKVGLVPSPGDKIRVSYVMAGDKFMAHKVMNVTKQDLRKK